VEGIPAPSVQRHSVVAPVGDYKVKIKVGDRELSQPVTVLKDPNAGGSDADLKAQGELVRDLLDDVNKNVESINAAENVRGQLAALRIRIGAKGPKDVKDAADALDKKVQAAEEKLLQLRITGRGQDAVRYPVQVTEQLLYLLRQASGSDYGPTASQREVHELLHAQAAAYRKAMDDLLASELAAFNKMLDDKQLSGIVAKFEK
jgi:hypothetical protein